MVREDRPGPVEQAPVEQKLTLEDGWQISQVIQLYGHVLDGARWELLDQVFDAEAKFDMTAAAWPVIGGRVLTGIDEIRSAFEQIEHAGAHHVTNTYVYLDSGLVRVLSKFVTPDVKGRVVSGEYDDVMRRGVDCWRIWRRRVVPRLTYVPGFEPSTALGADRESMAFDLPNC